MLNSTLKAKTLHAIFSILYRGTILNVIFPLILRLYFGLLINFVICVRTILRFKEMFYHLRDITFPMHYKARSIKTEINCAYYSNLTVNF